MRVSMRIVCFHLTIDQCYQLPSLHHHRSTIQWYDFQHVNSEFEMQLFFLANCASLHINNYKTTSKFGWKILQCIYFMHLNWMQCQINMNLVFHLWGSCLMQLFIFKPVVVFMGSELRTSYSNSKDIRV